MQGYQREELICLIHAKLFKLSMKDLKKIYTEVLQLCSASRLLDD